MLLKEAYYLNGQQRSKLLQTWQKIIFEIALHEILHSLSNDK
jgi:hypothetical protein